MLEGKYNIRYYFLLRRITFLNLSKSSISDTPGSLVATAVKHVGHTAGLMVIQASALLIVAGCVSWNLNVIAPIA